MADSQFIAAGIPGRALFLRGQVGMALLFRQDKPSLLRLVRCSVTTQPATQSTDGREFLESAFTTDKVPEREVLTVSPGARGPTRGEFARDRRNPRSASDPWAGGSPHAHEVIVLLPRAQHHERLGREMIRSDSGVQLALGDLHVVDVDRLRFQCLPGGVLGFGEAGARQ